MMLAAAGVRAVNYTRGAITVSVVPWKARTAQQSQQQAAGRVDWSDEDFCFQWSDLDAAFTAAGGTFTEPAIGDTITQTLNGTSRTFKAMTPDNGEKAFTYADTGRVIVVVHTKQAS